MKAGKLSRVPGHCSWGVWGEAGVSVRPKLEGRVYG